MTNEVKKAFTGTWVKLKVPNTAKDRQAEQPAKMGKWITREESRREGRELAEKITLEMVEAIRRRKR